MVTKLKVSLSATTLVNKQCMMLTGQKIHPQIESVESDPKVYKWWCIFNEENIVFTLQIICLKSNLHLGICVMYLESTKEIPLFLIFKITLTFFVERIYLFSYFFLKNQSK